MMTRRDAQKNDKQPPFPADSPGDNRPQKAVFLRGEPATGRHQALVDRMKRQVRAWEEADDRRCIFLHCYSIMSGHVLATVRAQQFADPDWVVNLMHHFAGYYFEPLERYDAGETPVPKVWQVAHDAAGAEEALAAQHLLCGVNAHINYDLALAVYDLLDPEWAGLSPARRQQRRADYDLINVIVSDTVNRVQDEVIEHHDPWMELLDRTGGNLDEWLAAQMIHLWRDRVWERSVALLEAESATAREAIREKMESDALFRMELLMGW